MLTAPIRPERPGCTMRRCGTVSDTTTVPDATRYRHRAGSVTHFFFSYSHDDVADDDGNDYLSRFFQDLCQEVATRGGIEVDSAWFLDRQQKIGQEWPRITGAALGECKVFVPIYSTNLFQQHHLRPGMACLLGTFGDPCRCAREHSTCVVVTADLPAATVPSNTCTTAGSPSARISRNTAYATSCSSRNMRTGTGSSWCDSRTTSWTQPGIRRPSAGHRSAGAEWRHHLYRGCARRRDRLRLERCNRQTLTGRRSCSTPGRRDGVRYGPARLDPGCVDA